MNAAQLPSRIFAQVSPVSVGGRSLFDPDQPVTSDNVANFVSEQRVTADAVTRLQQAGFEVLQRTAATINIAGPAERYEEVFSTRLVARDVPVRKSGQEEETGTFIDTTDNEIPGFLDARRSSLGSVLEGGALEKARYPMQSSPPTVNYWHLDVPQDVSRLTRADGAHAMGALATGVRLMMVDTGWEAHPWFAANGFSGSVLLGPGATAVGIDENGHGTGESANAFSVAPGITFTMVKMNFSNSTAGFNTAAILAPDVISCSWGSSLQLGPLDPIDQALAAAIALAVVNGTIVVFSAGNGHFGFPGQHPDVISAGGVYVAADGSRRASNYASGFLSQIYPGRRVPDVSGLVGLLPRAIYLMLPQPAGSAIDVGNAGPGFPNSDETLASDGWAAFSGTSAAAPQLAGACALLRGEDPSISPAAAREILMKSAEDVVTGTSNPSTGGQPAAPGNDLATGAGLVDAVSALSSLQDRVRPAVYETHVAGQDECARLVYRSADGHVNELFLLGGGSGWGAGDLTALTGAPLASGVPAVYQTHVTGQDPCARAVYRAEDGHIIEMYYLGGTTGWGFADLTSATGAPLAVGVPAVYETHVAGQDACARVVFRGVDGHIHEMFYLGGGTAWGYGDLTALTGAPLAVGAPAVYQTHQVGQDACARVVYRGQNGHLNELYYLGGSTGWGYGDLTAATGAVLAAGSPAVYETRVAGQNPCARVVYRGVDAHIHELFLLDVSAGWGHGDLTAATGAPPAIGNPAAYETHVTGQDSCARVVYRSRDGHLNELFYLGGSTSWGHGDLTALTLAPSAAGQPAVCETHLTGQDPCARVEYRGADGHVHELFYLGGATAWGHADLTALTGAPVFAVAAPAMSREADTD
ncbi:S8 family serine peptidase [Cryobacterium sp. MLB-32]|uniref:S8 family serine peptidase n=1 Tax=Cryobacterium sp. MLB-32 TaxID=1529318 RepID=UPI00068DC740|nr:S8 family serine peptidase [Cryobacterium sp. MLB-32]